MADIKPLNAKVGIAEVDSLVDNLQRLNHSDKLEETDSNPLRNPVILNHLFKLCPPKVLANFRLVCKQWRDVSLPIWRATLPLTFRLLSNKIHVGNHFTPLNLYLEYVGDPTSDCETKPFRYMKLADWRFAPNIVQVKDFWAAHSDSVNVLELRGCYFPNTEVFRKLIYTCFPNLQRLIIFMCYFGNAASLKNVNEWEYIEPAHGEHKSLRYIKVYIDRYNDTRFRPYQLNLPVTWLDLLSHFQNLTSLSFITKEITLPDIRLERQGLLRSIKVVRRAKGRDKLPLKFLAIFPVMEVFPSHKQLLKELQLPFDSITIHIQNEANGGHLVKCILEEHAKTLWKVAISRDSEKPLCWKYKALDIVRFDNLHYVQLLDLLCDGGLEFLRYMPRLRGLQLTDAQFQEGEGPFNFEKVKLISDVCREELQDLMFKDLTYFVCSYIVDDEDLALLIKWMPNMKKLEMILNDKQFGMVCQGWRNLRRLKVYGEDLTDEGVTGRKKKTPGGNANLEGEEGKVEEIVQPNITYLKDLRAFSFWSKNLRDASVLEGIVSLPNLKILQPCSGQPLRLGRDAGYVLWVKRIKMMGAGDDASDDEDVE